jgi:hypothetical protein
MTAATLDMVLGSVLDQCTRHWEKHNRLPPLLWAIGRNESIFAQPFDDTGVELDRDAMIGLHAVMAQHVAAVFLGRADEAFTQLRDRTEIVSAGDLIEAADTDPTIHRAICTEGLNCETGDSRLHVARFVLDDYGAPSWATSEGEADGELSEWNRRACVASSLLNSNMTRNELVNFAFSVHWSVVVSPTTYQLP